MNEQKNFIYVCYDKKDYRITNPIVKALQEAGYSVITSQEREMDENWAIETQNLIENCQIFMPVVTQNFIDNYRCRKEVYLADSLNKLMMTLFMERTPLKYGMALQLTAEQGLERYNHPTRKSFLNALLKSKPLQELSNRSLQTVTQGAFAEFLLYAVKQGKISTDMLVTRFDVTPEKATKVLNAMQNFGFVSCEAQGDFYHVYLNEFGFELLYFKNKKGVALNALSKDNKYVFISYAHKNSDEIIPILNFLQEKRVKIWFDEGIEVGAEWPATIQQKIKECAVFMPFVTPEFVESKNCRKEVYLADSYDVNILPVFYEDCELKYGLALQLSTNDFIKRSDNGSYSFNERLARHPMLTDTVTDSDNYITYDCFISCLQLLLEKGATSTSHIQRTLYFGYNRAFNVINTFLECGIAYRPENTKFIKARITQRAFEAFHNKELHDIII